jgi:hypothetical protein
MNITEYLLSADQPVINVEEMIAITGVPEEEIMASLHQVLGWTPIERHFCPEFHYLGETGYCEYLSGDCTECQRDYHDGVIIKYYLVRDLKPPFQLKQQESRALPLR